MPQLQIASLSANCISTLEPLSYCPLLQELYLRKNQIENICEIVYLKELFHLHTLWIGDNPCCHNPIPDLVEEVSLTSNELYRAIVIQNLPQVQFLDDIEISVKEREAVETLSLPRLKIPEQRNLDIDHSDDSADDTGADISLVSEYTKALEMVEDSFEPVCTKEYNCSKYLGSEIISDTSRIESDTHLELAATVRSVDLIALDNKESVASVVIDGSVTEEEKHKVEIFSQNFDSSLNSHKFLETNNPVCVAIMQLLPLLDANDLLVLKRQIEAMLENAHPE